MMEIAVFFSLLIPSGTVSANRTVAQAGSGRTAYEVVPPVADFTADVVSGDAPLTVNFTDQSTSYPATRAWDVDGDGIFEYTSGVSVSYTYLEPGNYTVSLFVTNSAGSDWENKTDYITVNVREMAFIWGPYLLKTTSTGTMISARTNAADYATVEWASETYWNSNGVYDHSITDVTPVLLHQVSLTGLEPDTTYCYRVTCGGVSTEQYKFRTFPESGPFTFAVISDTQDQLPTYSQYERYKLVADALANETDIAFVLHTGDHTNRGDVFDNWTRYFNVGRDFMAKTAVFPALGNHEYNSPLYYETFDTQPYYSFDCGDAHFTVLNSNLDEATQAAWLTSDLQSAKSWKFVGFHHPPYTSDLKHFGGWENLRAAWEGIFIENGVDAVWNGHVHAYERYIENGITYTVLGTGGGPTYMLNTEKYTGYQNSLEYSLAYARVTVDPDAGTATVRIIRVADISPTGDGITTVYPPGTVYDTFTLTQAGAAPGWDLNGDHVINIGDVVKIGLVWGQSGSGGWIPEDLNNDGTINIGDVVVVGLHWGETW